MNVCTLYIPSLCLVVSIWRSQFPCFTLALDLFGGYSVLHESTVSMSQHFVAIEVPCHVWARQQTKYLIGHQGLGSKLEGDR